MSESGTMLGKEMIMSLSTLTDKTGWVEASSDFVAKGVPFASASHLCALTIDRKTGIVHIEKYFLIDDCGVAINQMIVDGRAARGSDSWSRGRTLSSDRLQRRWTANDYQFHGLHNPNCCRSPGQIILDHVETLSPVTLHGSKGVGETGTIGTTLQSSTP